MVFYQHKRLEANGYKSVGAACSKPSTVGTHRYTQGSLPVRDCDATSDSIQLPHFILQILPQFSHIESDVTARYPAKQYSCAKRLSDNVLVMSQWANSVSHNVCCRDTREMPCAALADIWESLTLHACARSFVFNSAFSASSVLISGLHPTLSNWSVSYSLRYAWY
jgi:hypothetical protein